MGVNTVRGVVNANELGKTLMHEHFMFGQLGYRGDMTLGPYDKEEALRVAQSVADRISPYGVKTVVDVTPNENGRDAEFLKEASELTGLHIICSTGFYYENAGASPYFGERMSFIKADIAKEMTETFVTEITKGIGHTGVKAGIIKIATNTGKITAYEEALFKAAAAAQKETGVPIITHTQDGTMGPEQADLLLAEGACPEKIIIGHMDGNLNVPYHLEVLKKGVNISLDRMGLQPPGYPTDEERVAILSGLLALGYADKIMLSHDTVNYWLGRKRVYPPEVLATYETYHVAHVYKDIIPQLHRVGFSEQITDAMTIENPKRVLDIR